MENLTLNTFYYGLAFGVVFGMLLSYLIYRLRNGTNGQRSQAYNELKQQFDDYRAQVNAHFSKTADAVDNLTKSYQTVFNQLTRGAEKLMDKKSFYAEVEKRQGKSVTLSYLPDEKKTTHRPLIKDDPKAEVKRPLASNVSSSTSTNATASASAQATKVAESNASSPSSSEKATNATSDQVSATAPKEESASASTQTAHKEAPKDAINDIKQHIQS